MPKRRVEDVSDDSEDDKEDTKPYKDQAPRSPQGAKRQRRDESQDPDDPDDGISEDELERMHEQAIASELEARRGKTGVRVNDASKRVSSSPMLIVSWFRNSRAL